MGQDVTVIRLPVPIDGEITEGLEELPVQLIKPNQYKLLASPGMVDGLAAGDIFMLQPSNWLGYEIIQRGGNICVQFYFSKIEDINSTEAKRIQREVEELGGWLDGGLNVILIFTIPASVGLPAIKRVFEEAKKRDSNTNWFFSNIYDPKDGVTPLNWWLSD